MKFLYLFALLLCAQICAAQKLYLEDLQQALNLSQNECEEFLFQKGYVFTRQGSRSENGQNINTYTTKGNKLIKTPKTLIKVIGPNPKSDYVCYQTYDHYEFDEFERMIKEEENYTRSDTVGSDRSRQYHKDEFKISFETKREPEKSLYTITLYHASLVKRKLSLPKFFKKREDDGR
ncbi:hypothetical protein GS399_12585 [Pedobacter sp. HMF7647]|uniref:Uncharacterized protein n=1 Tax=Hufsiella arboris TaxID=2695275 RepID=A0A7K1YB53_9SPHI|nr:hypothetical protein [Hufsiella arboris]MXV51814.1 hypothetical protein [Hufsiella arboris]